MLLPGKPGYSLKKSTPFNNNQNHPGSYISEIKSLRGYSKVDNN